MATIRLALGLLCVIHPLVPGAGVSLGVCALGLWLILSALLADVDDDDPYQWDLST